MWGSGEIWEADGAVAWKLPIPPSYLPTPPFSYLSPLQAYPLLFLLHAPLPLTPLPAFSLSQR